jgi:acyl-coenzyme A synthetase/AMP-(fatty) acid ligase
VRRHEKNLHLYGAHSDRASLPWPWVDQQLAGAGTCWVIARNPGHPHPRPVWGIWSQQRLHLSIGSPTLLRAIREERSVTVHLDSGTNVVIVEGPIAAATPTTPPVIQAYNQKHDWDHRSRSAENSPRWNP